MRDHLLGYTPAAKHSAEAASDAEWYARHGCNIGFDFDHYPLGVPKRVKAQWAASYNYPKAAEAEAAVSRFEDTPHPNPDGTFDPVRSVGRDVVHAVIADVFRNYSAQLAENIQANNSLLRLKGISCKPAPGEVITVDSLRALVSEELERSGYDLLPVSEETKITAAQFEQHVQEQHGSALQTYMAGYAHARQEEATTTNQHAGKYNGGYEVLNVAAGDVCAALDKPEDSLRDTIEAAFEKVQLARLQANAPCFAPCGGFITGAKNSPWHAAEAHRGLESEQREPDAACFLGYAASSCSALGG